MLFTHDTQVALSALAALVNTAGTGPDDDTMTELAGLDAFVTTWHFSGNRTHDRAELAGVRTMRARLRRLWSATEDEAADLVNTLLREAHALPQLVRHDGWDYHLHATAALAPLAEQLAVEVAMAMADVIRTKQLARLRVCAADGCGNVMVDLSRNRSRRFCDTSCANRVNVAAFRARRPSADRRLPVEEESARIIP